VLAAGALLVAVAPAAPAQRLVSPGPLAAAHARYDNLQSCLLCHDAGRELSGHKCLACHTTLAARIRERRGFHASETRNGSDLRCASCHSDHNGRPYRMVRWPDNQPVERFDHARAGWRLDGAHARERCAACHRAALVSDPVARRDSSLSPARTYLGLGTACGSCHLDEHRGRVDRDCAACHTTEAWKPVPRFDHARTDFALEGRHRTVACAECHEIRRDVSTGPGGARDTSYLDFRAGRRGATGCASCHTSPHRDAARFARCEACHSVEGWFVLPDSMRRFDHTTTGFPLRGAHGRTRCEGCHLTSPTAPLPPRVALVRANFLRRFQRQPIGHARCADCHADVHTGELRTTRDCDACHDERAFAPTHFGVALHDSTLFPLSGAHIATPCAACHQPLPGAARGSGRVRFRHGDQRCTACHQDPHRGQFAGRTCDACHATASWDPVAFDHERTRYPLRGAHARVACGSCHRPGAGGAGTAAQYRGTPTDCRAAACHGDPHGGQFAGRSRGDACTTCHSESAWRPALFDHRSDSDWPLDGAHRDVACRACHRPTGTPPLVRFRPLPSRCEDCHTGGGG
jgi:hypothetical protein